MQHPFTYKPAARHRLLTSTFVTKPELETTSANVNASYFWQHLNCWDASLLMQEMQNVLFSLHYRPATTANVYTSINWVYCRLNCWCVCNQPARVWKQKLIYLISSPTYSSYLGGPSCIFNLTHKDCCFFFIYYIVSYMSCKHLVESVDWLKFCDNSC